MKLLTFKCLRCHSENKECVKCMRLGIDIQAQHTPYSWIAKMEHPKVCPHCHSAWWNVAKDKKGKSV